MRGIPTGGGTRGLAHAGSGPAGHEIHPAAETKLGWRPGHQLPRLATVLRLCNRAHGAPTTFRLSFPEGPRVRTGELRARVPEVEPNSQCRTQWGTKALPSLLSPKIKLGWASSFLPTLRSSSSFQGPAPFPPRPPVLSLWGPSERSRHRTPLRFCVVFSLRAARGPSSRPRSGECRGQAGSLRGWAEFGHRGETAPGRLGACLAEPDPWLASAFPGVRLESEEASVEIFTVTERPRSASPPPQLPEAARGRTGPTGCWGAIGPGVLPRSSASYPAK